MTFLFRSTMLIIPLVETFVVGPVWTWPRVVLQFLFFIPPTSPVSAATITSFLYGNGVPCSLALQFVKVCHEGANAALLEDIYDLYAAWSSSSSCNHSIFWHLRRRTHMLNGPYGPHTIVEPPPGFSVTDNAFGFDAKPRSIRMRLRLYYLRAHAHIF